MRRKRNPTVPNITNAEAFWQTRLSFLGQKRQGNHDNRDHLGRQERQDRGLRLGHHDRRDHEDSQNSQDPLGHPGNQEKRGHRGWQKQRARKDHQGLYNKLGQRKPAKNPEASWARGASTAITTNALRATETITTITAS